MGYKGHRSQFRDDTGHKPGHRESSLHGSHTSFSSRSFGEEKGSNTKPDSIHMYRGNKATKGTDGHPNHTGSNNPYFEAYHSNSGTSSEGHCLCERGGSVIHPSKVRGY